MTKIIKNANLRTLPEQPRVLLWQIPNKNTTSERDRVGGRNTAAFEALPRRKTTFLKNIAWTTAFPTVNLLILRKKPTTLPSSDFLMLAKKFGWYKGKDENRDRVLNRQFSNNNIDMGIKAKLLDDRIETVSSMVDFSEEDCLPESLYRMKSLNFIVFSMATMGFPLLPSHIFSIRSSMLSAIVDSSLELWLFWRAGMENLPSSKVDFLDGQVVVVVLDQQRFSRANVVQKNLNFSLFRSIFTRIVHKIFCSMLIIILNAFCLEILFRSTRKLSDQKVSDHIFQQKQGCSEFWFWKIRNRNSEYPWAEL